MKSRARSVVFSAKVPKELKEHVNRFGIEISKLVREPLESEVTRLKEEKLHDELVQISSTVRGKVTGQDFVTSMRRSREER